MRNFMIFCVLKLSLSFEPTKILISEERFVGIDKNALSLRLKIVTISMEPPSQVKSNQLAGVGSDDPLSRLYTFER